MLCFNDHTSTIERGYWFGNDTTLVSICPNNYCNFDSGSTTNGFYQLSPPNRNQCRSHRSGTACGSCDEGYTLSFDSVECVKCTTGQTVLVVTLLITYWIVIVILVFIMTYYHVGTGYLYAITYYNSMLDILLGQNFYLSQGFFTTVSIFSSFAKITPQFLGQLCFVRNRSGIDQELIHYVHPLAVTIITLMICLLAKVSQRFSLFISGGIIHTVCFLLLLSYTSVTTTSLLLLRSLRFDNMDKVYTYLSPDIEYCHGRHLPYFIVAVFCTIVIVIGLPLLLLLEPFLNHRINFTKIKPILDQFQGCYKDKYRFFAAYYMICRILIMVIIVANPLNYVAIQFSLVTTLVLLASIQLTIRPYASDVINIFDGFVLQIMSLISLSPLINNYNSDVLIEAVAFILVLLPTLGFIVMELFMHKSAIKKIKVCVCRKPKPVAVDGEYSLMDDSWELIESKR